MVSIYDSYRPLHAPDSIRYNGSEHFYADDANGNLTGIPDFSDPYYTSFPRSAYNSIDYNADNMPVRIENRKDDGAMVYTIAVDFTYDGNGTRAIKALSNGDTTYYIGDHFEVANGVETKYIFAGNQRIAKVTDAATYYFHKDHLGSSSVMTDYPDGFTVETTEYLPFGHERNHTGAVVTDYKFTDQEKDTETGLYNYDARMYDPVIALFISADSLIPDVYDPQSLNRYAYCRNNPLKYVDPDGHAYDIIDVGFFVQSAYTFARNPSWANAGWLAADTVSLLPVVPSLGYGRVATKIAGKVADVASNANKADNSAKSLKALENAPKKTDFVVDSNSTAVRNSAGGARKDLENAGFSGTSTTETLENGTMHRGLPGKDGPMDVRVMDGQTNGGPLKGPRVRTTRAGHPNDGVRTDGSKFRNNESKSQRLQESHIHIDQ